VGWARALRAQERQRLAVSTNAVSFANPPPSFASNQTQQNFDDDANAHVLGTPQNLDDDNANVDVPSTQQGMRLEVEQQQGISASLAHGECSVVSCLPVEIPN